MKILHVISDLDCHAAAKQLTLLHRGLSEANLPSEICTLSGGGIFEKAVQQTGNPVETLRWRRPFDLRAVRSLKQTLERAQPNVIHVWGSAYRMLPFFGKRFTRRSILAPFQLPKTKSMIRRWFDKQIVRRVAGLLVRDEREEFFWRRLSDAAPAVYRYTPAVDHIELKSGGPRRLWSADDETEPRTVAIAGRLLPEKGTKTALLAFDMLRHIWPDMHLIVMGAGPEKPWIARRAGGLFDKSNLHFLGASAKVNRYFRIADVVWAPDERDGGQNAVLEALSIGKLVVASDWPLMRNIVVDGETGMLFQPGSAAQLASKTFAAFNRPDLGRQIGAAGRRHVRANFSVEQLVQRMLPIYERAAA